MHRTVVFFFDKSCLERFVLHPQATPAFFRANVSGMSTLGIVADIDLILVFSVGIKKQFGSSVSYNIDHYWSMEG